MRLRSGVTIVLAAGTAAFMACVTLRSGDDRRDLADTAFAPDTAAVDARGDVGLGDTSLDAGPCPLDLSKVPILDVPSTIASNTVWDCHARYRLTDVTYVLAPATLTISAGTTIVGNVESGLVVTRGAKLVAEGTAGAPIVFSSSQTVGRHTPGGWGGVLLLGDAPMNDGDVPLAALVGPTSADPRARYGGTNDTGSCGTLRYVRFEFGGDVLPGALQNAPALGLAGCGSSTVVEFVQTHLSLDVAIKVWGGSVGLKHVVATRTYGDSIHLTNGYHGKIQFVAAQNDPARDGRGFVIANNEVPAKWSAVPRTTPLIYNVTLIGAHERASRHADAIAFARGGFGRIFDSIFLGYGGQAVVFTAEPPVGDVSAVYGIPDQTDIESSDWFQIGPDDTTYFTSGGDAGVDSGSAPNPATYFRDGSRKNLFGVDPDIRNPYVLTAPSFALSNTADTVLKGAQPPPPGDSFFVSKRYMGAVGRLVDELDWTLTWTRHPAN